MVSALCEVDLCDRPVERMQGRYGSKTIRPCQKSVQQAARSYGAQLGSQRGSRVLAFGVCIAATCFNASPILRGFTFFECGSPQRSNHSRRRSPVLRHSNAAYFSFDLYTM